MRVSTKLTSTGVETSRLPPCRHRSSGNGRGPGGLAPVQRLHGVGPAPSGSRNTWKPSTCIGCSRVFDATNMASSGALSDMVFLGLEDDVLGGDKPTSDGRCEGLTATINRPSEPWRRVSPHRDSCAAFRYQIRAQGPLPTSARPQSTDSGPPRWATCRVRCGSCTDLPDTKRTVDLRRILADRRDRLRWPAPPNGR